MQPKQKQITIWIDSDVRESIRPYLNRDGLSLSSFVRKAMADYLESRRSRNTVINIDDVEAMR